MNFFGTLLKKKFYRALKIIFSHSFLRYIFIGLILNSAGFLFYIFLTMLEITPAISMSIVYFIFTAVSFFFHKNYSFQKESSPRSFIYFSIIHLSAYSINLLVIFIFVYMLNLPHQFIQGISVIFLAVYLYFMMSTYVFKRS